MHFGITYRTIFQFDGRSAFQLSPAETSVGFPQVSSFADTCARGNHLNIEDWPSILKNTRQFYSFSNLYQGYCDRQSKLK